MTDLLTIAQPETPCPGVGHTGYVPGRGNLDTAEFFYLGEAAGASEVAWRRCPVCQWEGEGETCPQCKPTVATTGRTTPYPSPFVGKAGQLARKMLTAAGISLDRVYFTNVIKCRPPENKYPKGKQREACESHCEGALYAELRAFAANEQTNKVIICAGAQAFRALTGLEGIQEKRGYVYVHGEDYITPMQLEYLPVLIPTIHPAFLFRAQDSKRDEEAELALNFLQLTVADYMKAARLVATGSLQRPPSIWVTDGALPAITPKEYLSIDLEYEADRITLASLGEGETITVLTAPTRDLAGIELALNAAPLIVGHALITADLPVLEKNGVISSIEDVLPRVYDTMIAQHLLYPDYDSGLGFWGSTVTDLPYWKDMPERGENVPIYCGRDNYGAGRLYEEGCPRLEALDLLRLLPVQQQAQAALYRMAERGVKMDRRRIPEAKAQIAARLVELEAQMPFKNARSNPEVHDYFGDRYRLPHRGGRVTVDKHTLIDFIAKHNDPVARLLLEHRELSKIESTYLTPYEEIEGDEIHSRFDVTKQGTGRISSAEPNLFQLPKRPGKAVGDLGFRLVRSLVIPNERGWFLMEADWQQIELRLVALFAKARSLQRLLADGVDVHGYYAQRYDKTRDETKVAIHGGNYMASPYEVARNFGQPVERVAPIMEQFMRDNPEIPRWWEEVAQNVQKNNGIFRLPFGRIRRFNGRVADWQKAAISTGPQGTVADMLLRVIIELERESVQHLQARILFPCHDSVLWAYPPDEQQKVYELTRDVMERPWPEVDNFSCPVDIKVGSNWADVKKVTL